MVAGVGTEGDEFRFVLDVVQILTSFDRSEKRSKRLVTLAAKLIDQGRVVQVGGVGVVGVLDRL